jgi:hypothetical protein
VAFAAVWLVGEAAFRLAPLARGALSFDVGPSTGAYLAGVTESEERPPVTFRWTRGQARVALPLVTPGGQAYLTLRYARFVEGTTPLRVSVGGGEEQIVEVTPGRFRSLRLPVTVGPGPLTIRLDADAPGPENLGVALDWLRLEGVPLGLAPRLAGPRVLLAGAFLAAVVAGLGAGTAALVALATALALALWAAADPFGCAHVATLVAWPATLAALAAAALLRRLPGARAVALLFLAGYVLKGAAVFCPSYFYPDVRNHGRYTMAFAAAKGSLAERGIAAQKIVNTGYPRIVAGRAYVFPYSPLFFVPFSWLTGREAIEEGLKHAALFAAAAEMLLVFALARAVGSRGVLAALLAVTLPPLHSRLLLAMYPTLVGHLLDLLAIVAAAALCARPASRTRLAAFGSATFAALVTYISSLFNLPIFTVFLALRERRLAKHLLGVLALTVLGTVAWLYLSFTLTFVTEIVPALVSGSHGSLPRRAAAPLGPLAALSRVPIFFGWAYPLLTLAGLAVLRRRAPPASFSVLFAYALTLATLTALKAFGGGLFRDLKEETFAAPLVAVATGAFLEELAGRVKHGRLAAGLMAAGLVVYGLAQWAQYLAAYSSLAGDA